MIKSPKETSFLFIVEPSKWRLSELGVVIEQLTGDITFPLPSGDYDISKPLKIIIEIPYRKTQPIETNPTQRGHQ